MGGGGDGARILARELWQAKAEAATSGGGAGDRGMWWGSLARNVPAD